MLLSLGTIKSRPHVLSLNWKAIQECFSPFKATNKIHTGSPKKQLAPYTWSLHYCTTAAVPTSACFHTAAERVTCFPYKTRAKPNSDEACCCDRNCSHVKWMPVKAAHAAICWHCPPARHVLFFFFFQSSLLLFSSTVRAFALSDLLDKPWSQATGVFSSSPR